jgi:hypothetical protein
LLHVSSANKFGAEIKVLPVGLLQIQDDVVVSFLQVTLIRVEDDGLLTKQLSNLDYSFTKTTTIDLSVCHNLFLVVLAHQLHRQTGYGRLEIRLLGVDHHSDVQITRRLCFIR